MRHYLLRANNDYSFTSKLFFLVKFDNRDNRAIVEVLKAYLKMVRYSMAIALFLVCTSVAAQPMSGSFTINKTAAATNTNFTSFQSFFNALAVKGVGGSVNCKVVSGSGPYIEQVTITTISGTSSANSITINGDNEILRFTATVNNQQHTLKFDGADYVTVKNLSIEALGSNYAWAVHITNDADNNTLDNCTIKISNYTGTFGGIGIAVVPSNTVALAKGSAAKNLTITSCTITGEKAAGPGYGIIINSQPNGNINSNITIQHTRIEEFYETGIYAINSRGLVIKNNAINRPRRETCAASSYGIRHVNSNQQDTIVSNRIYDCYKSVIGSAIYTHFYGIYIENSSDNLLVANNAIYNNHNLGNWYGVYLSCSKNTGIFHNTIYAGGTIKATGEAYGFVHGVSTCNNSAGSEFINNNIDISRGGNANRFGISQQGGAIKIHHNNIYVTGANAYIGKVGTADYKTLADWQGASGNGAPFGEKSTAVYPNFTNVVSGNLIPQAIGMDNSGDNVGLKQDIVNAPRTNNPDVGAFEFNVDANVSRIITSKKNYCLGESDTIKFWVVNKSLQVINNFSLGFTIGSNVEMFEQIKDTIPFNDSLLVTLSTPILFQDTGIKLLYAHIKGKPQVGPKNIVVNALPNGSKINKGNIFSGWFNGGDAIDPDIIAALDSSEYEILPPTNFTNSGYGATWQIEAIEFTVLASTKKIGLTDTITFAATNQKNAKLLFKPSSALINETLKVGIVLRNNSTGCLSNVIERFIKVVGKPTASFAVNSVCEGGTTSFNNLSTGQGTLTYKWYFGDGDSSVATNPQKKYSFPGTFNVKLYTYTKEGFVDSATAIATVYNSPNIGFIFKNQCEGIAIDFFDTSKVFYGQANYKWNFGDGIGIANTKTPSYLYGLNGVYTVSLSVKDSIGCESQLSKQVTFAKKPNANFSVPPLNCNQKKIAFTNNTVSAQPIGFVWYFGDGDSTTVKHSEHTYANEGVYTVSLLARNSFNCVDTIKKVITLLGTPVPNFIPSTTCANETVLFKNTTKEPLNTEVNYLWTINKTTTSQDVSPVFTFTAIGMVDIELKAQAKNGCTAVITKSINFTEKPIADFVIPQNVCAGFGYEAVNNTVLSVGSIDYRWTLGTKTSTLKSPIDTFYTKGNYLIELIASTSAGCADTVLKTLNVLAIPNSEFLMESRKTGDGYMIFTPVEAGGDGNYNWKYGLSGGSNNKQRHEVQFTTSGKFTITLQIINQGCASITSKDIFIDLTSINDIENSSLIKLFPNPSSGEFNIQLENNEAIQQLKVLDRTGKLIFSKMYNYKISTIDENLDLKNGVYLLKIVTKTNEYSVKMVIVN